MIEAVVFDVDGVLVESMVFAGVLEQQYRISRDMTAGFFQGPFKECILGTANLKEVIFPYLQAWGWAGGVEDFLRVWLEADSRVDAEMLDFVKSLRSRGLKCFVASTQEAYRASYLEQEMGFGTRFDGLFFSCHLGCEKPDPAFYRMVESRIGLAPENILFLDDREANVDGARAAGWNAERYEVGESIEPIAKYYGIGRA